MACVPTFRNNDTKFCANQSTVSKFKWTSTCICSIQIS